MPLTVRATRSAHVPFSGASFDRKPSFLEVLRKRRVIWIALACVCALFLYLRSGTSSTKPEFVWDWYSPVKYRSGKWSGMTNRVVLDELQALLFFVSDPSTADKRLPTGLDPEKPIAPRILAGGKRMSRKQWVDKLAEHRKKHPVVVFSKTYCGYSRRAKELLGTYKLAKPAHVVEVDTRSESELPLIKAVLKRITGRSTFPNVIIQGKSFGGADDVQTMHDRKELEAVLQAGGAIQR